jgi:hypothetical protein
VSRLKTTIRIALIAIVMLVAAGMPAAARTAARRAQVTQVTSYEQSQLITFWQWLLKNLSRYAMAAN